MKTKNFLKSIILMAFVLACTFAVMSCEAIENGNRIAQKQQERINLNAVRSIEIPQVTQFAERATVARWTKTWDNTTKPCYVYLFVPGVGCIGYYISSGKPASSRNYLVPEYTEKSTGNGAVINTQQPDLDGTYGDNNPGIRFFTASGSAVEYGGSSFAYVYSDTKLNIKVPCLGQ